ncbi:hypothetical protein OKW45_006782 [Paraburkholderia sp. WSM4175]|uniref:hypothetical protein n=1 Tax=Paraburkholderia sp. WSM4175 TaxID=2991072 RepID=UPI003D19A0EA
MATDICLHARRRPIRLKNLADPIERRYQKKRRRSEKSPARSLHKHNDRSRFEASASEIRDQHEQYVQRRRVFMTWKERHAETLGAMIPVRRTRIDVTVRFDNLNPAVSFSISANSIRIAIFLAGRSCDLRFFDSDPRRVAGGYVDDSLLPEYVVVHSTRQALWHCEVFDPFLRWFEDQFAMATEWLSRKDEHSDAPHKSRYS